MDRPADRATGTPEAGGSPAPRIAFFTHDTFGLGHIRRCQHLIREVSRRSPHAPLLLISGSPAINSLPGLPRNADYLKIPTVARTGPEENRPPHLPLPSRELTSLRKHLVREALSRFRPDLFVVDNFPLGSRGELIPALERMRQLGVPAVLGLRDIVDQPQVVRRAWTRAGIYEVLDSYYERILVYGSPDILDAREAYAMPPEVARKVRYCGLVTSNEPPGRSPEEVHAELGLEPPMVLGTVGGGGDGLPLLSVLVRAVRRIGVSAVVVTGPLMAREERRRIAGLAEGAPAVRVREFLPDLPSYLAAAELVVAMGGYNTTAEIVALGRRALIMPRNWRYGEHAKGTAAGLEWEQVLRARALEAAGIAELIDPQQLEAGSLGERIRAALARPANARPRPFDARGAKRAVDRFFELVCPGGDRAEI